ncbi:MAG: UDP-N-acetylmuramoyl-L-alanine--D-glutamate ligase [Candidatus Falkowbacteria bacterium]|nr:UDP-N-acetylmuramoyl-L-alanine--D-glutamate ligase [Candidatus Falkowbacteria bacterium]
MEKQLPKSFIFKNYSFDQRTKLASFSYSFDGKLDFQEVLDFSACKTNWHQINLELLDRALFNLHLALGVGYFKAYCPKKIEIKSGTLNKAQAEFWNKLYEKGLGEFFYRNKIDFRGLINLPAHGKSIKPIAAKFKKHSLLPIGGGKDSCLSAEKLKSIGQQFSLISLRDSKIQKDTAQIVGAPRVIIGREMDARLFRLNESGAYNGHVPISAIYSWTCVVAAILGDFQNIIFSNEHSANFGNVRYLDTEINHQYSKSFEFEQDFANYLHNFLTPDLQYFSLLRPYSELKIAREFSKYPQYFGSFSSCNRNFKINGQAKKRWCGTCAKCAFSLAIFAAWNSPKTSIKIFGANLLDDKELLPVFQELWGEKAFKPFDCVGTPEEVKAAFVLICENHSWDNSLIVEYFRKKILPKIKDKNSLINSALRNNPEHLIPDGFQKTLLLGFGKEGKFAFHYWRKKNPGLKIWLADRNKIIAPDKNCEVLEGKKYLKHLEEFDLIIKTPGITNQFPEIASARIRGIKFTSITEIFLKNCRGTVIGITGTKGKSTTATLIFRALKAAGKKVYLVGNIGNDPLKYLKNNSEKDFFVYEMSSYQLENLQASPKVAVMINIFPDHLPYHGGFQNYCRAKANITKWQQKNDYFVYDSASPFVKLVAGESLANKKDYHDSWKEDGTYLFFENEKLMPLNEIKLPGKHNLKNITAAATVIKALKIPLSCVRAGVKNFPGLEHRLELVGEKNNLYFYDDAISTTPESTLVAIEYLEGKLDTIILGGEDRGYDFSELAKKLKKINISNIVLFPFSGVRIKEALENIYRGKSLPKILETSSMKEAVIFAAKNTADKKAVLLSTASPSYSIFKNFQEKGRLFKEAIKNL